MLTAANLTEYGTPLRKTDMMFRDSEVSLTLHRTTMRKSEMPWITDIRDKSGLGMVQKFMPSKYKLKPLSEARYKSCMGNYQKKAIQEPMTMSRKNSVNDNLTSIKGWP